MNSSLPRRSCRRLRRTCAALSLLLPSLFAGVRAQAPLVFTYDFAGLDLPIPDADAPGIVDTRDVTTGLSGVLVGAVKVSLDLEGTGVRNGDYYATLQHDNELAVLLNRVGRRADNVLGYGDPGLRITLDDGAENGDIHVYRETLFGNHVTALGAPLTGAWKSDARYVDPSGARDTDARTDSLSSLNGLPVDGAWRLYLADLAPTGVGVLHGWSLQVTGLTDGITPLVFSEATVRADGGPRTIQNPFRLTGDTAFDGDSVLVFAGAGTVSGPRRVAVHNTTVFAGGLGGDGSLPSLAKDGNGTLELGGTSSFGGPTTVNEGTLRVTGDFAQSAVSVNDGGTLTGGGRVGALVVGAGGTVSPGESPGRLSAGDTTFAGGGTYVWQIDRAGGTQGGDPGWDYLHVTGDLTITATSVNPFRIRLVGLADGATPGAVPDFNPALAYEWPLASATGALVGYDRAALTLDLGGFLDHNALAGGAFDLKQVGAGLDLTFTPVPEPGSCALLAGGLAALVWATRVRERG